MQSNNLFKCLIYSLVLSLLIICLYYCVSLIVTGIMQNYNKAAWYYQYNQVEIESTEEIEALKNTYPSMIGYKDEYKSHTENLTVYQLVNSSIDLAIGHPLQTNDEVIISREIANHLLQTYQLDNEQELLNREFCNYRICGITTIQTEEPWCIYIKESTSASTNRLLFSPDTDMEILEKQFGFPLYQHDKVIHYVQRIMKALDIFAIISLFCLGLDLLLSKLGHFSFKHTILLNIISVIMSMGIIYLTDHFLDLWLSPIPYLQLGRHWEYIIVPVLFVVVLNLGIKKIKFFN